MFVIFINDLPEIIRVAEEKSSVDPLQIDIKARL